MVNNIRELSNSNSLLSKYIKQLLKSQYFPLNKIIYDGQYMYEGCDYYYRGRVLRCTKTGMFCGLTGTLDYFGFLTVLDDLEVNDSKVIRYSYHNGQIKLLSPEEVDFTVTDDIVGLEIYDPAEFELVSKINFDAVNNPATYKFISNSSLYDDETHRMLGEYLRLLKSDNSLNLMSLYNCCPSQSTQSIKISKNGLVIEGDKSSKCYMVPIKFDTVYTIAVDCPFNVTIKPVFFDDVILKSNSANEPYWKFIKSSCTKTFSNTHSSKHNTFSISRDDCITTTFGDRYSQLHKLERYLKLCIQVPVSTKNSPVVLEGDFNDEPLSSVADINYLGSKFLTADDLDKALTSKPSLLASYDGPYMPFSPKLVEYLLNNTIDCRCTIGDNVKRVRDVMSVQSSSPMEWDHNLRYSIFNRYMELKKNRPYLNYNDILGYVDSDIESAMQRGFFRNE